MPNYRYRPNYKKPKDNNWIVIFILFMIFGGGSAIAGIISGLFPLLIIGFVIYGIMNSKNGGNSFKKYSSSFENSTFRSYRNNSYRPIYNTFNGVNNDYENINKKLALYFEVNKSLNVMHDISLRLKSDAYISLSSLNVYKNDNYVCTLDEFKSRYPDIHSQIIKWLENFDVEYYLNKKTENKKVEQQSSSKSKNFIKEINDLNTEIPDEGISNGLYETSALLKQVEDIETKFPTSSAKLDKLYEYYLPMLIKNLNQYKTLQAAQSNSSFEDTKLKLQKNITLINEAIKTIIASLCEEDFINLSADISTLESLLKKDGLAGGNRISTYKGGVKSDE